MQALFALFQLLFGGTMEDPSEEDAITSRLDQSVPGGVLVLWSVLVVLALVLAVGAVTTRLLAGPRFDWLLIAAACATALMLALRLPRRTASGQETARAPQSAGNPLQEILDSAGPAFAAIGPDRRLLFANPATERMLGYDASELISRWTSLELLAPGESARVIAEMQKLCGKKIAPDMPLEDRFAAYLECVQALPPSRVPCFDIKLRHKDGTLVPVTLHISALRDSWGTIAGVVAVAVDQSATLHREQDLRESQERYRDLFENSSEMIATLSPAGRFLYANPAWKICFGLDQAALLALDSFEDLFSQSTRTEVAALFRRALDGETVERSPLRFHAPDGHVFELELSLSQRQKAGNPLAIRCLLRDVTHQKQREHRMALQLVVSQIVGESPTPEVASIRILEALCVSQGWDLAIRWDVDPKQNRLSFSTAWGAPGRRMETLIQESMGLTLPMGEEIASRAWKDGHPVWITDLTTVPESPRVRAALGHGMVSGWAMPVRVGNNVLAVLEFYCQFRYRYDSDAMASIETAATSLGQMLARSQERGRAEKLYRQQEILLDSVADGICGVDRHGHVSFANPAAARLLGAPASSLTGKPVHDLLHGTAPVNLKCTAECPLKRATGRQAAASGEDNIFRADGSAFAAEYTLTPILDQGHFSGSVLSFRDVSQRNALDRLKDEFISTVSHELRTPLTSIRGALGLLASGKLVELNDKASSLLRIALTNSDRLVRLINDILDLERIQSGREPLSFRPVELSEIVVQAIGDMQPVAEAAGVQLLHDTSKAQIDADPYRLLQVLTNLLSNAVKFSPPNSTVSIMLRPGVSGVTLSVIDHGRGIPADKLDAVFGRFQQVDASDSRQKGGSGLGLAICRSIVLQHSGRIWAERNPIRGTTFRVFLPYHPSPLETPISAPDSETGTGTLVLAGASAESRFRIATPLARHGYRVIETTSVEQTVSAVHKGVEAVLLDTSLDGINGWEILPLLRRLDPEARTPVVLLSVGDTKAPSQLSKGHPKGVEGWVARPLNEDALLGEIAQVLCGPGEKARILVVEDDLDLATVIGSMFERDNIAVELAHTLDQALEACFRFQPHLLVLDIGLPDGDGFNVVDWLRQHESLARLPLVVYSGRDLTEAQRKHLTLGPTHFLTKATVQPQQLEALVLTMLRNSRQIEESAVELPTANK
jgi:PAS domain S-box-containing protein